MTTPRPWEPGVEPTVDQLASFLAICTHEERVAFVAAARNAQGDARICFEHQHEERLRRNDPMWCIPGVGVTWR